MGVKEYLIERMTQGAIHMALLDPDKQGAEEAGVIARRMKEAGTDAVMIGGSTGVTSENLGETARSIREASGLPTIHFPGNPAALSEDVDAIFFMSMVNSTMPFWIIEAQASAAERIKGLGVETISLGYIVVEPGMTVGQVGKADTVKHGETSRAVGYALACEMLGMDLVYLEAGSGADRPVPPDMISAVKKAVSIPLIVGGGIRTPEAARAARLAGADAIVTGTFVERCSDDTMLRSVVEASKRG
ncbi:MAG: geranylgeranylglyceryl/heptaprenylglyceryl phosphate synthase [Methanomassiliicoccaceae archaeon]|nr:geranylgeranylglyceryl/heptaprenylglyceryl phosphate synthase [Methanomassiliicoccaceae archaeon]